MISIDSDIMRSIADNAASAVQEIHSGQEKLLNVTTHDDWNCRERDQINERVTELKKSVTVLQQTTERYLEIIKRTADRFDVADLNITKSFQGVRDRLGKAFSIPTPNTHELPSKRMKELKDSLTCGTTWMDVHRYYGLCEIDAPLKVCSFSDFDFSQTVKGSE